MTGTTLCIYYGIRNPHRSGAWSFEACAWRHSRPERHSRLDAWSDGLQLVDTLNEINERHMAVKELEKSLLELHQMFLDMAVLVEAQGVQLDSIEKQVCCRDPHCSNTSMHFTRQDCNGALHLLSGLKTTIPLHASYPPVSLPHTYSCVRNGGARSSRHIFPTLPGRKAL